MVDTAAPATTSFRAETMDAKRDNRLGGSHVDNHFHAPVPHDAFQEMMARALGPAMMAFGDGLERDVRQRFSEPLGQRETDNLREHVARVQSIEKERFTEREPTRGQRRVFAEWMDEAAEHDPKGDPRSAAKWQAILSEIMGRNDEIVISALRQLNIYDIKQIANLGKMGGRLPSGITTRLSSMGLVEPRPFWEIYLLAMMIASLLFVAMWSYINMNMIGDSIIQSFTIFEMILLFSLCTGLIIGVSSIITSGRVFLTELGRDVKAKIDQYLN